MYVCMYVCMYSIHMQLKFAGFNFALVYQVSYVATFPCVAVSALFVFGCGFHGAFNGVPPEGSEQIPSQCSVLTIAEGFGHASLC